jgi:xanthine dehydrogenase YagR molybdenum-binding subunit
LEDYHILGIGDVPEIEIHYDETRFENRMRGGACGLSELSTLSIAPALGNAVFNATGWRPTELPLRPYRVIGAV